MVGSLVSGSLIVWFTFISAILAVSAGSGGSSSWQQQRSWQQPGDLAWHLLAGSGLSCGSQLSVSQQPVICNSHNTIASQL